MMRFPAFLAILVLGIAGCATTERASDAGLAHVLRQPGFPHLPGLGKPDPSSVRPEDRNTVIRVEAVVVAGDPRSLREAGLDAPKGRKVLDPEERKELLSRLETCRKTGRLEVISRPTLGAYPGQNARLLITKQKSFVVDFDFHETMGVWKLSPRVEIVDEGLSLSLCARVTPQGVLFPALRIHTNAVLGVRNCCALVGLPDNTFRVHWQEPALLRGMVDVSKPRSLLLKHGETAVLPLRYRVRQQSSNVRALALAGHVEEDYRNLFSPSMWRACPLNKQFVVLLSARAYPRRQAQTPARRTRR